MLAMQQVFGTSPKLDLWVNLPALRVRIRTQVLHVLRPVEELCLHPHRLRRLPSADSSRTQSLRNTVSLHWATWVTLAIIACSARSAHSELRTSPDLDWPLEVRELLLTIPGDQIICAALASEFKADIDNENRSCKESVTNRNKTAIFRVAPINSTGGYEIYLRGISTELILDKAAWCERHKFDVFFAFDRYINLTILVLDNEPMVRTTPNLEPEADELFEYLPRANDRQIFDLQERIRSAIVKSFYDEVTAARIRRMSKTSIVK
jgi:hypothetical protein